MMRPGEYLRLCRVRAGLSIRDVAVLAAENPSWVPFNVRFITAIEAAEMVPTDRFTDRMRGAFAFDRLIVRQLICRLDPEPEICRVCGCSALDACDDELTGPCSWASPAHDLCTSCAPHAAIGAAPLEETHHA